LSVIDYNHIPIITERVGALQPLEWEQGLENLRAFHEETLSRAMNKVKEDKPFLKVTKELAEGRPEDEIIRAVRYGGFDMIFIGSRGLGGIKRAFLRKCKSPSGT
jgi:nucleotide-binding universal stress UspA family protein